MLAELKRLYPMPPIRPDFAPFAWKLDGGGRDVLLDLLAAHDVRVMVEIGVLFGGSALQWLGHKPDLTVIGIDPWEFTETEILYWWQNREAYGRQNLDTGGLSDDAFLEQLLRPDAAYLGTLANLWAYRDRFVPVRGRSPEMLHAIAAAGVQPDLVYIDSEKQLDELETCLDLWPEAIIAGDDWTWSADGADGVFPVQDKVGAFAERHGFEVVSKAATWYLVKPLASPAVRPSAPREDRGTWFDLRRSQLKDSLIALREKKHIVVRQPFFYLDTEIPDTHVIVDQLQPLQEPCDIYFSQGYAPDIERLIAARQSRHAGLISCWFWDNHHLIADTVKAASLSDVTFYAHYFNSHYIKNKLSIDGAFVPLCPGFWTESMVQEAATRALLAPRFDALYGGYNSYIEFPDRDVIINRVRALVPNNRLFMTPHGTPPDQHPYYGTSKLDRLLEWMKYKVSLSVSFGGNTAMRMFDALLGGGIPLVLGRPADLDMIIPRAMQEMLPIVVLDDPNPEGVAAAYRRCLELFEEGGPDGVMRRHHYILANHMPHHRLAAMVGAIRTIAARAEEIDAMLGA